MMGTYTARSRSPVEKRNHLVSVTSVNAWKVLRAASAPHWP